MADGGEGVNGAERVQLTAEMNSAIAALKEQDVKLHTVFQSNISAKIELECAESQDASEEDIKCARQKIEDAKAMTRLELQERDPLEEDVNRRLKETPYGTWWTADGYATPCFFLERPGIDSEKGLIKDAPRELQVVRAKLYNPGIGDNYIDGVGLWAEVDPEVLMTDLDATYINDGGRVIVMFKDLNDVTLFLAA